MNNNSKQKDPIVQYLNSPYYYSPIKPAQEYSYSLVDKAASVSASILSLIFVGCALATALAVINPVLGFAVLAALLTSTMPSLFYLATVAHPAKKQFDKEQIKTEEDTKRQEVQLFKSVQKAFSSAAANDEEEMQLMETMQNLV